MCLHGDIKSWTKAVNVKNVSKYFFKYSLNEEKHKRGGGLENRS